tara:strand:+ start:288 stop:485 length:198 start_codon:yes stop_codon:yes gene_type:complete
MPKINKPTDPKLYARVKRAAERKFPVYPSAYANMWLVREYKKRGGTYIVSNKPKAKGKGRAKKKK